MVNNIAEPYYSKVPAVICTAGSYIARANSPALARDVMIFEGKSLYDHMEPSDVLKFEALFASEDNKDHFSFPLKGLFSFKSATAVFETLWTRRFAVVFLFCDEKKEREPLLRMLNGCEAEKSLTLAFAKELLAISESLFEKRDHRGLTDIKSATAACVARARSMYSFRDMEIVIEENSSMKAAYYMPAEISMKTYIEILMLMLSLANRITGERKCRVRICKYGMDSEVRVIADAQALGEEIFDTDSLGAVAPTLSLLLAVCEYAAGVSGGKLSVTVDGEGTVSFVFSIGELQVDEFDFKSRDCLLGFENDFSFVMKYIDQMLL